MAREIRRLGPHRKACGPRSSFHCLLLRESAALDVVSIAALVIWFPHANFLFFQTFGLFSVFWLRVSACFLTWADSTSRVRACFSVFLLVF
jgi:hypothetical protein